MIGIAIRGDGVAGDFRQALEPLRTGQEANHNYSVSFSADARVFQRLQWGGCTVVRTRDPERFGRALAFHLSGHGPPPEGLIRADGVLAVRDGRAIVLPATLRQSIPKFERPLRNAGVILHDAPWVDVDPHQDEVVVQSPRLPVAHLEGVIAGLPAATQPDPAVAPGRYPLTGWYFATATAGHEPMAQADAVGTVLSRLRSPLHDAGQPTAVADVFSRVPFSYVLLRTASQLLDQLSG